VSPRIRFTEAKQVFEAFKTAERDIGASATGEETPAAFLRRLASGPKPTQAIAFCAYLLPRREAVWWACQCVRAIDPAAAEDAALAAAERWVREPEEGSRRAALDIGASGPPKTATVWLARAAGWSGGSVGSNDRRVIPPPPYMTAKAVNAAIAIAVGKASIREQNAWRVACAEAGIRFAEGGDARPILSARRAS
jgi:hypothetical protein